jgi:acetoacetyl-CoA synthetase
VISTVGVDSLLPFVQGFRTIKKFLEEKTMAEFADGHKIMWTPSEDRIANSRLTAFMKPLGYDVHDYAGLHKWSCQNPNEFWSKFWDFAGVIGDKGKIISQETTDLPGHTFENTRFFVDSKINFTENALRKTGSDVAITAANEAGSERFFTFDDLHIHVSSMQQFLKEQGVQQGDRVAGFIPNVAETVIAMLATVSIGAIWTSCSPDFGVQSVYDRFSQTLPKVLVTSNGYFYGGKNFNLQERVLEIEKMLPSIQKVVVINSPDHATWDCEYSKHNLINYEDVLLNFPAQPLVYERFDFNLPMLILYSSGTTGVPKCIVHGAGGTLITHMKEHQLQCDIRAGDKVFYFTTCGWMMWNWLVSSLASSAGIVVFDGSPLHPTAGVLFDVVERNEVTFFGVSAKYFSALEKNNFVPQHELPKLRTLSSTGSPLTPESYEYIYTVLKSDVHLMSISGGTDIVSCFFIGNPNGPVRKGELQCAGLAYKMEVFSEQTPEGEPGVALPFRQQGELVCTMPFPSQPLFFWSDFDAVTHLPNKPAKNYHKAYFTRYANAWHHGDHIEAIESGGFIIHGRSDAILNPGGVRIGTGEIYRQVEQVDEVMESMAVAQTWGTDDVRVVLFVILRVGITLDDDLITRIKQQIRKNTTPRHVPARILQVADLPRTKNGKLAEIAVRNAVNHIENTNLAALANPQSLDLIREHLEDLKH